MVGLYIDYAKSDESGCKRCKCGIKKGTLRFGITMNEDWCPSYLHYGCLSPEAAYKYSNKGQQNLYVGRLRTQDAERATNKLAKLLEMVHPRASVTKRSKEEMTKEAEEKLDNEEKEIRLLEIEVESREPTHFTLDNDKFAKLQTQIREQKDLLGPFKVSTDFLLGQDEDPNILLKDCFWDDLPLPEKPEFDPKEEALEVEHKKRADAKPQTYNKSQAKKKFCDLRDADLDVIPYDTVPNPNHLGATMRSYNIDDLTSYLARRRKLSCYWDLLVNNKKFTQRMDNLQKALCKRGFPLLNALLDDCPLFLHKVTDGYTDEKWNITAKKHPLTATKCAIKIIQEAFPIYQQLGQHRRLLGHPRLLSAIRSKTRPQLASYIVSQLNWAQLMQRVYCYGSIKDLIQQFDGGCCYTHPGEKSEIVWDLCERANDNFPGADQEPEKKKQKRDDDYQHPIE